MTAVFYIDSSAVVKLLLEETHSQQLTAFYDEHRSDAWVSSSLMRIEVARTVTRALPSAQAEVPALLAAFGYLAIDDEIVEAAAREPDPDLRSLDAIHLASARVLGEQLAAVVTYDERLAAATTRVGLPVHTPGR
ncbi:type II toxin-antitoxin system VapC family toxin [soil metagenome]